MKFFTMLFMVCGTLFGSDYLSTSTTHIPCSTIIETATKIMDTTTQSETDTYLKHSWSGDEDQLYLNLNIMKDLEFPNEYIIKEFEDGQGCEIRCEPMKGKTILYGDDILSSITVDVSVKNTDDPRQVAFTLTINYSSKKDLEIRSVIVTMQGTIKNPAINLSQEPEFFITNDGVGVISFKNATPYSQMQ